MEKKMEDWELRSFKHFFFALRELQRGPKAPTDAEKLKKHRQQIQRLSARQLFAFTYFAFEDLTGQPKQMNKLNFGEDKSAMEFMTARNMSLFLEGDEPWLYQEKSVGHSFNIRLTDAGVDVCRKIGTIGISRANLSGDVPPNGFTAGRLMAIFNAFLDDDQKSELINQFPAIAPLILADAEVEDIIERNNALS